MTKQYSNLLLHLYQPPWQSSAVCKKIIRECYAWLTEWIKENDMKVTINMNFSLAEILQDIKGGKNVLDNIVQGVNKGVIELTTSAAYHALLPKIPDDEIKRQLKLNNEGLEKIFGFSPSRIVFPPEMAISSRVVSVIKKEGYEAVITDAPVYDAHNNDTIPHNNIATVEGFPIFFRSTKWSNRFSQEYPNSGMFDVSEFTNRYAQGLSKWFKDNSGYSILAFDGETIGHHQYYTRESMTAFFEGLQKHDIVSIHLGELLRIFPRGKEIKECTGSWSTTTYDIWNGIPYPLWDHPANIVHKQLWELTDYTIKTVQKYNNPNAREKLDKGLNSCQYWWAESGRFNPQLVCEGVTLLYEALVWSTCPQEVLIKGKELTDEVIYALNVEAKRKGMQNVSLFCK